MPPLRSDEPTMAKLCLSPLPGTVKFPKRNNHTFEIDYNLECDVKTLCKHGSKQGSKGMHRKTNRFQN